MSEFFPLGNTRCVRLPDKRIVVDKAVRRDPERRKQEEVNSEMTYGELLFIKKLIFANSNYKIFFPHSTFC